MPRYKVGSDTYTIPDDNTEAIEVMNTTYPDASVLADDPEDDTNKLDDLAKITAEIKDIAGEDMEMDNLDSPNRVKLFNELVGKYNKIRSEINPLYLNQKSYEGEAFYTGGETLKEYQQSSGSVFTEEGGAKLRQIEGGFDPLKLDEVVVTGEEYKKIDQEEQSTIAQNLMYSLVPAIALLGKPGEELVESMAGVTDDETEGKDMSSTTSAYNTLVNSINQLNTVDNRAGLTLAALLGNTDILPNVLGFSNGEEYRKYWAKKYAEFSEDLDKRNQFSKQTIGFTDLPDAEAGYVPGGLAASFNALMSFGTSAATSYATFGVGLATDMIGGSLQDFNQLKADSLGLTVEQLCMSGQCETLTPLAIGTAGFLLERAGLKSALKYINGMPLKSQKGFMSLLNAPGTREGSTEFVQFGLEEFNRQLALGLNVDRASEKALDLMFSKEGVERLLQGFVGGEGVARGGRLAQASIRSKVDNEKIANNIRNLNELENSKYQKNLTREQIQSINNDQQQIIDDIKSTINKNNELVAALTPEQLNDLDTGARNLIELNKKRQIIINDKSLDNKTKQIQLQENQKSINNQSQEIYDIRNTAEKIVSNIKKAKGAAQFIDQVEIQDFANAQEVEAFIKERKLKGVDSKQAAGEQAFIYQDPNTDEQVIIINREQAAKDKTVTAPFHETLHALLFKTLKNNPEAAIQMKEALQNELNALDPSQIKNSEFKSRLELYKNDPDALQAEEYLTLFVEALNTGDIKYKENFATKLGDVVRRGLQNFGVKIKFNTGRDVYNALKDFNVSMEKGTLNLAQVKLAKEGAKGELIETKVEETKIQPETKFSKAETIDALVGPKTDGKYTMTKAEWDAGKADQAIGDLYEGLQGLIKSKIPSEKPPGFSQEDFISGTIAELIPHIRNFNPEQNNSLSGWINSQLQNKIGNVFKKGEAATKDVFEADVAEARGVAVEDTPTPAQEKSIRSKLRRDLKIDKDLIDKVKQAVRKTFGTKLPEIESKEFKQALQKAYRTELKTPLAELLGTRENYKKFLEDNFESIYKALPQDILNKRFRQFAEDTGQREKTPEGKKIFKKRSIDKQEFVDYFLSPDVGTSTKGTRKDALAETLGEIMALDATMEVIKEPEVKAKREDIAKLQDQKVTPTDKAKIAKIIDRDPFLKFSLSEKQVVNAEKLINEIFDKGITEVYNDKGNLLPEYKGKVSPSLAKSLYEEIKFGDFADFEKASYGLFIKNNKNIPQKIKDKFLNSPTFRNDKKQKDSLVKDVNVIAKKLGKPLMDFLKFDVFGFYNRALDPAAEKESGKPGEYYNALQKIVKSISNIKSDPQIEQLLKDAKKMNKAFPLFKKIIKIQEGKFGKTKKEKLKALKKLQPEIEAANVANIKIATFVGQKINELYRDGKISAQGVLRIFQLQTSTTGGLRALTRLSHVSLEGGLQKGNKKGEHLDPNANTMATIAGFILDPNLDLKESNSLIETAFANHDQWLTTEELTDIVDKKGGKNNTSKQRRLLFLDIKNLSNVYTIDGNPFLLDLIIKKAEQKVAPINNKKLPAVVKFSKGQDYTNQMVLDKMAELDKEQSEAQMKFSKSQNLSDDFNKILENKTGIGADKVYSDVKAQVVGANKGKFNFFVPPSAEDFVGLLYKTLGKGKLGDAQMAWYKKNLLDPFARAMDNISRDRIALMNDFKALKKDLKIVPKNLKKKLPGEPFTQEQAVRTYIWNKQGMSPDGMSKADLKELTDFVESKPELALFADQLIALQKGDKYPAPKFGWLAGNITTDLMDGINTIKRNKYLEQWQYNVDDIFTKANLNKLEAAYGKEYRTALEGMLKRMRTGRNREFTSDSLTGRVTDWLTNSIGAIMFFNTRSAVLQTISAVNFINFKDNNIFAAGKAFANQPQFWKDFKTLFNSDFLVDRRNGLKLNVNEADIADMAKKGGVRGVISEMLRLGFLPTQIADSFAIASGGSSFYRNRIKKYTKEGMSKVEAEDKAFIDFREIAEEAQQSSRPDRISAQQAGPLGRIILAFANTPMQYTRLIKKAASDLKNGRGDTMTNISKIFYYGVAQNLLFNAMQQALFAMGFGDDEEETEKREEKYANIVNSMADSILRGAGIGGAIFSVLKNTGIKLNREAKKKSPKFQDVLTKEIAQLSPPVSSKLSKLRAAGRSYSWNKKEMMEKGFSLDNPAYLAAGQVIAATTNVPLDRAFKKIDNIRKASSSDYEAWARIAMLAGWSDWELGVKKEKPKKRTIPRERKERREQREKKEIN
jgi:hypothetical protein